MGQSASITAACGHLKIHTKLSTISVAYLITKVQDPVSFTRVMITEAFILIN
jgi:hypothetical protein